MTRLDWTPTHLDGIRAQAWATWISWGESQRRALTREYHEATATGMARPQDIPVVPDAYFAPGERPAPAHPRHPASHHDESPAEFFSRVGAMWGKWPSTRPQAQRCRHGLWTCVLCGLNSGFPMTGWHAR